DFGGDGQQTDQDRQPGDDRENPAEQAKEQNRERALVSVSTDSWGMMAGSIKSSDDKGSSDRPSSSIMPTTDAIRRSRNQTARNGAVTGDGRAGASGSASVAIGCLGLTIGRAAHATLEKTSVTLTERADSAGNRLPATDVTAPSAGTHQSACGVIKNAGKKAIGNLIPPMTQLTRA